MTFEGEMEREDWLERTVGGVVAKSPKLDGNYYVVVFCSPPSCNWTTNRMACGNVIGVTKPMKGAN